MPNEMQLFNIDVWHQIFVFLNLFILFLIMKKFLFKPIMAMIEARDAEIKANFDEAEAAKDSAIALENEYREKIEDAKSEAASIVKNAKKTATIKGEEILKEANEKAHQLKVKADKDIEIEISRAKNVLKDDISDIAISLASKIVDKEVDKDTHNDMISKYLSEEIRDVI